MKNAITIENLSKNFNGFTLNNLNLSIPKGYITGFIGPNGAGKSTTINLIMDLIKADAGKINILGFDHDKEGYLAREQIGFVYAENVFYDHLSVQKTGQLVSSFYRNWSNHVFLDLCKKFDLPLDKKVKKLSTGMKVKLFLAIALSHDADLIILDEPTSGLDPLVRSEILTLLYEIILNEDKTIFFSSHITTDLEKIADYIIFINQGEIIMQGEKDEIMASYCIVKGPVNLLNQDTRSLLLGTNEHSGGFVGLTKEAKTFKELFGEEVLIEPATLEDIMVFSLKEKK